MSYSSAGPSSSSVRYAPTTTPTPGQALLRQGKMLVYPSGWPGCPKCQNTGYKRGDPSNPCRRCWDSYSQKPNPILISSAGMQGAKVLQKPLPQSQPYGTAHFTGEAWSGNNGIPGSWPGQQQPMSTGGSFQTQQMIGQYAPPAQPPPTLPPRRGPPQVIRAEEANETLLDENGEAPPAYDDAVAAGPDGILPPQRRNSNGQIEAIPTGNSNGNHPNSVTSQHSGQSAGNSYRPPPFPPDSNAHQHYQNGPHQYPYTQPSHQQWPPQHSPHMNPYSQGRPPPMMSYSHRPPPGAIVLQPGDPRIGGQLCLKCGGAGVRESLFFGDETCSRCGGSGRVF